MKNRCEIHFELNSETRQLQIVDWTIRVNKLNAACDGDAERQKRVQNARKTPFQFALAMAHYKAQGRIEFSLDDEVWFHFRENLQKLAQPASAGSQKRWLLDFIGGAESLRVLFDWDDKLHLRIRADAIRVEEIHFFVCSELGEPCSVDLAQLLADYLKPRKGLAKDRHLNASRIEPDADTRARMQEAARQMLGVAGLGEVNELILGKAAYLSKVLETQTFSLNLGSKLGDLRDEIRRAASFEDFIDCHADFRLLCSDANRLEPFFRDVPALVETTQMIQDMELEYLTAIATLTPTVTPKGTKISLSLTQLNTLNKAFDNAIRKCRSGGMNIHLDECRGKMRRYVEHL